MTSIIYKCSSCDYKSNKKNNVHRHYCNHHINIDIDSKKCGKTFSSNKCLKNHLDICKGVSNPLECHICHKVFANRFSKSFHLKSCKNKN